MKSSWVTNYRLILIVFLLIIILVLTLINPFKKEVSFGLDDRCGPIMNLISHTIKDAPVCRSKCKSQCEIKEMKLNKIEFYENQRGCNNCTCFCR